MLVPWLESSASPSTRLSSDAGRARDCRYSDNQIPTKRARNYYYWRIQYRTKYGKLHRLTLKYSTSLARAVFSALSRPSRCEKSPSLLPSETSSCTSWTVPPFATTPPRRDFRARLASLRAKRRSIEAYGSQSVPPRSVGVCIHVQE